jgi:hypothetical protein
MKKLLTFVFAFSTCLMTLVSLLLWNKYNSAQEKIKDRELVISSYIKVIEAVGRTKKVTIEELKKELQNDFDVHEKPYQCCDDGLLYHTILTKNHNDWRTAGDYMGGIEIITDSINQLQTVAMYKP